MRLALIATAFALAIQFPVITIAQPAHSSLPASAEVAEAGQQAAPNEPTQKQDAGIGAPVVLVWFAMLAYAINKWARWKQGFKRGRARSKEFVGAIVWTVLSFVVPGALVAILKVFA